MTSINPLKVYRALALLIGCALFVYLLIRLGPAEILSLLLRIGWYFGLIIAAYVGHQMVRAVALGRCIIPNHRPAYWDLVRIRVSGEAVRFLTFTGPFLAEPAKALLLRKRGLSTAQAFAAITSEYLVYTFTSAAMAAGGLSYLLHHFDLSKPVAVAARVVMYAAAAFLVTSAYAVLRRVYLIGTVIKGIGRIPLAGRFLRVDETKLRETEDLLFTVLRARPSRLMSIAFIEFCAQALLILELLVLLRTSGQLSSIVDPLVIESASKFVGLAFFFVPGQIGAAEGTYAVIFEAVGLPAFAGFSLALARRLRTLLVAGLGLAFLLPGRRGNG